MPVTVAINGFGRIGRALLRSALERQANIEVVAVNDVADASTPAALLRHDSVYGSFPGTVAASEGAMAVNGSEIRVLGEPEPGSLPWRELGVDVVLECTGRFRTREAAATHLEAGARKVIISAPAKGSEPADATVVLGVNFDNAYDPEAHHVITNASCTTNCLALVAKVLHDAVGIRHGLMTTVHAYTADQNLLDGPQGPAKSTGGGRSTWSPPRPGPRRRSGSSSRSSRTPPRLRRPGADTNGLARRPDRRDRARDERGRGQCRLPRAGRQRRPGRHPRVQRRAARRHGHRGVAVLGCLRRPADERHRRHPGEGGGLVRQRMGLRRGSSSSPSGCSPRCRRRSEDQRGSLTARALRRPAETAGTGRSPGCRRSPPPGCASGSRPRHSRRSRADSGP